MKTFFKTIFLILEIVVAIMIGIKIKEIDEQEKTKNYVSIMNMQKIEGNIQIKEG